MDIVPPSQHPSIPASHYPTKLPSAEEIEAGQHIKHYSRRSDEPSQSQTLVLSSVLPSHLPSPLLDGVVVFASTHSLYLSVTLSSRHTQLKGGLLSRALTKFVLGQQSPPADKVQEIFHQQHAYTRAPRRSVTHHPSHISSCCSCQSRRTVCSRSSAESPLGTCPSY